jgi:hypothetical protein
MYVYSPVLLLLRCPLPAFAILSRSTQRPIHALGSHQQRQRRVTAVAAADSTQQHDEQYRDSLRRLAPLVPYTVYDAYQAEFDAGTRLQAENQQLSSLLQGYQGVATTLLFCSTGLSSTAALWLLTPEQMTLLHTFLFTLTACELWQNSSDWYKWGMWWAADQDPTVLVRMLQQTKAFVDTVEACLDLQQRTALTALMLRLFKLIGSRESGVYVQLFMLMVHSSSPQAQALAISVCGDFEQRVQQQQQQEAVTQLKLQGIDVAQGVVVVLSYDQLQQALRESRDWGLAAFKQQQQAYEQLAATQPENEAAVQLLAAVKEVQALLLQQEQADQEQQRLQQQWQQQQAAAAAASEPKPQHDEATATTAAAAPDAVVADVISLQGHSSSDTAVSSAVTGQQQASFEIIISSSTPTAAAGTAAATDVPAAAEKVMAFEQQQLGTPVDAAAADPAANPMVPDCTPLQGSSNISSSTSVHKLSMPPADSEPASSSVNAAAEATGTAAPAGVAAQACAGTIIISSSIGFKSGHNLPAIVLPDTASDRDVVEAAPAASVAAAAVSPSLVISSSSGNSSISTRSSIVELQQAIVPGAEADSSSTDTAAAAVMVAAADKASAAAEAIRSLVRSNSLPNLESSNNSVTKVAEGSGLSRRGSSSSNCSGEDSRQKSKAGLAPGRKAVVRSRTCNWGTPGSSSGSNHGKSYSWGGMTNTEQAELLRGAAAGTISSSSTGCGWMHELPAKPLADSSTADAAAAANKCLMSISITMQDSTIGTKVLELPSPQSGSSIANTAAAAATAANSGSSAAAAAGPAAGSIKVIKLSSSCSIGIRRMDNGSNIRSSGSGSNTTSRQPVKPAGIAAASADTTGSSSAWYARTFAAIGGVGFVTACRKGSSRVPAVRFYEGCAVVHAGALQCINAFGHARRARGAGR